MLGSIQYRKKISTPIWLMLIFYSAAVILVFVSSRFRIPLVPILCVLAGGGAVFLYDRIKEKAWPLFFRGVVIVVFVAFLTSMPGPFDEEEKDRLLALTDEEFESEAKRIIAQSNID